MHAHTIILICQHNPPLPSPSPPHQLDLQKVVVERMVHLALCGYAVCVVSYLTKCATRHSMDHSLIRHFVHEVTLTHRVQSTGGGGWRGSFSPKALKLPPKFFPIAIQIIA